jgi:hypothetical protein
MGDRLLGFPIKRYKYLHCYNIDTYREGCLQGLESFKSVTCNISVVLSYFVLQSRVT